MREEELSCFQKGGKRHGSAGLISLSVQHAQYLRVIDLKAILSDSLALKNDLFLEIFSRHRATQSFYQGKLNKQRKTFKKSKGGSLPLV